MTRLRFSKLTDLFLYASTIIFGGTSIFFFLYSPIALQKALSIRPANRNEKNEIFKKVYFPYSAEQIKDLVGGIPYKPISNAITDIYPPVKFQKTIGEGQGNCSNLTFGAAYYSYKNNLRLVPIHLLAYNGAFLKGIGHTVAAINTTSGETIIVDFLEGGIPMECGNELTLGKLQNPNNCKLLFKPLNDKKDRFNPYFNEFLRRDYAVGIHKQAEVDDYHKFMELIYIPLGNTKAENIVFNTIAIIFQKFPNAYVPQKDYEQLFARHRTIAILSKLWLFSAGLIILLLFVKVGYLVGYILKTTQGKR